MPVLCCATTTALFTLWIVAYSLWRILWKRESGILFSRCIHLYDTFTLLLFPIPITNWENVIISWKKYRKRFTIPLPVFRVSAPSPTLRSHASSFYLQKAHAVCVCSCKTNKIHASIFAAFTSSIFPAATSLPPDDAATFGLYYKHSRTDLRALRCCVLRQIKSKKSSGSFATEKFARNIDTTRGGLVKAEGWVDVL